MDTTIANVVCLMIGFGSAASLMTDASGTFRPDKADGMRIALALVLCFIGGFFTHAPPREALHAYDWIAIIVLLLLAMVALSRAPMA